MFQLNKLLKSLGSDARYKYTPTERKRRVSTTTILWDHFPCRQSQGATLCCSCSFCHTPAITCRHTLIRETPALWPAATPAFPATHNLLWHSYRIISPHLLEPCCNPTDGVGTHLKFQWTSDCSLNLQSDRLYKN